jgi:hypothetical protein
MCTYILYHDPDSSQPFVMASTREDFPDRPTKPAFKWDNANILQKYLKDGRLNLHFTDNGDVAHYLDAGIVAPQDEVFGGSFAGINKHGLVVTMNNRENLIDIAEKQSRGGLVLDALTFSSAKESAEALYEIVRKTQLGSGKKYPVFNLIIADDKDAYVVMNAKRGDIDTVRSEGGITAHDDGEEFSVALAKVPPKQVVFIGGYDINDLAKSRRTEKFLPLFEGKSQGLFGKNIALPNATSPESFGDWLAHMVHEPVPGVAGDPHDFSDPRNPFNYSVAQPNPNAPDSNGFGDPRWVTISTGLYTIQRTNEGTKAEMYQTDGPPRFGRMEMSHTDQDGKTANSTFNLAKTDLQVSERPASARKMG